MTSRSSIRMSSVISRHRTSAGRPVSRRMARTPSTKPGCESSRGETLTLIVKARPYGDPDARRDEDLLVL
jgi:hypothetical protein